MRNIIPWDRKLRLIEHVENFDLFFFFFFSLKKIGFIEDRSFPPECLLHPYKECKCIYTFYILILQHVLLHLYTGPFGGMRAAMALRAITGELGCLSVSNIFGIPTVQNAFDEEGNPKNDHMESGAKKMLDQLEWMATAMKNHREKVGVPS